MTADRWGAACVSLCAQGGQVIKRGIGRSAVGLLAAGMLLFAGGIESASAQLPSNGILEEFDYSVSNVQPDEFPGVLFTGGIDGSGGGRVELQSGQIRLAEFMSNAWEVIPTGTGTLNFQITDWRIVTSATVTGTASVPAGATMTVTPLETGHTTRLTNGQFSIPSGVGARGVKPPKGGSRIVKCRGSARSCQARISLAGGAHNRRIVIRLTDTNLALRSVKAPPRRKHAAYMLTNGKFVRGRSEYVVTLNAARSCPRGSHLILAFTRRS